MECYIQIMFEEANAIIKEVPCMKFYDETKQLYIETDISGVGLGAVLLQTRGNMSCHRDEALDNSMPRPIMFTSKSLTGVENRYSNIEREALDILYGLEKFPSLLLCQEVSIITDHKPLIAIFKEDVATLSQRSQQILLRIHQYRVRIIYKLRPDLFKADLLSRQNHNENRDEENKGMEISINVIQLMTNVPGCMTFSELKEATSEDQHLQHLMEYIIKGWPDNKGQLP